MLLESKNNFTLDRNFSPSLFPSNYSRGENLFFLIENFCWNFRSKQSDLRKGWKQVEMENYNLPFPNKYEFEWRYYPSSHFHEDETDLNIIHTSSVSVIQIAPLVTNGVHCSKFTRTLKLSPLCSVIA